MPAQLLLQTCHAITEKSLFNILPCSGVDTCTSLRQKCEAVKSTTGNGTQRLIYFTLYDSLSLDNQMKQNY